MRRSLACGSRALSGSRRARTRGLLVLVVVGALSGCGGGEEAGRSLEDFAGDANRECVEAGVAAKKLGTPDELPAIAKYARDLEAVLDRNVAELKRLKPPEGEDAERAREFVAAYEDDLEKLYVPALRKVGEAAEAGNRRAMVRASEKFVDTKTPNSDRLAKDIGAPACAEE